MTTLPDIRQIQLTTGVSIVGYIVEETEESLSVETPFEIIRSGNTAEWAVYLHMCDDDHIVNINKNHVICSFECNSHFKFEYIKMMERLTRDDDIEEEEEAQIDDDDDAQYYTNNNILH